MPRNPNKRRCQQFGCHNWAMRDSTLCRSHRDHELGPRGAGAPYGNINAWRRYRHVPADTQKLIRHVAYDLYDHPDRLQEHIAYFLDFFYNHGVTEHVPRTLKALQALKIILEVLVDAHADVYFRAEMQEILSYMPPERQANAERRLWEFALKHTAVNRVYELRKAKPRFIAGDESNPQLPVHDATSEEGA